MKPHRCLIPALVMIAGSIFAGEVVTSGKEVKSATEQKSIYDKIWGLTTLYKNKDNAFLQELSLVGREQFDWFYFDANQGQEDDWVVRRTRIGLKAKVLQNITLHTELDLNLQDPNPLYNKL